MKDLEIIILEDNIEYVVIDKIISDDVTYVYLTNKDDEKDFCIRKIIKENGKDMLSGLNSEAEYDKALLLFTKKHNK